MNKDLLSGKCEDSPTVSVCFCYLYVGMSKCALKRYENPDPKH